MNPKVEVPWYNCEVAVQVAPEGGGILYVAPIELQNIGLRLSEERRAFIKNKVQENLVWFPTQEVESFGDLICKMTFTIGWYNAQSCIEAWDDLKYITHMPMAWRIK